MDDTLEDGKCPAAAINRNSDPSAVWRIAPIARFSGSRCISADGVLVFV